MAISRPVNERHTGDVEGVVGFVTAVWLEAEYGIDLFFFGILGIDRGSCRWRFGV